MEILRRRIEDTMLYFICGNCHTEFKADKSEAEMCIEYGQREEKIVKYRLQCPDCGTECAGMTRNQYLCKRWKRGECQ